MICALSALVVSGNAQDTAKKVAQSAQSEAAKIIEATKAEEPEKKESNWKIEVGSENQGEDEAVLESKNQRPGIVHRLDKDTSGVIITARNRDAEEWLQSKFYKRKVYKEYIAIVKGNPKKKAGEIVDLSYFDSFVSDFDRM